MFDKVKVYQKKLCHFFWATMYSTKSECIATVSKNIHYLADYVKFFKQ